MYPEKDRSYFRIKKLTLFVIILILGAALFGWWLGNRDDESIVRPPETTQDSALESIPTDSENGAEVKALITYTLPDGWKEFSCPTAPTSVFFLPAGADNMDCSSNGVTTVKLSVDTANNKDCNQLQNVENVSKHVCISEFINGMKSLKAETVYNEQSSYETDTTVRAYYINTGKAVIKAEYIYQSSNKFQSGFEQLAKSVRAKN